jgi:hypothetical protein
MARFIFEATVKSEDSARQIQREVEGSEVTYLVPADAHVVAGICPDYSTESLGLRVMNLDDLIEFKVNRVLAECTAADARRWLQGV